MRNVARLEFEVQQAILQQTGVGRPQILRNALLLDAILSWPTVIVAVISTGVIPVIWIFWGMNSATLATIGLVVLVALAGEAMWVGVALQEQTRQRRVLTRLLPAEASFSLAQIHNHRLQAIVVSMLRDWWLIQRAVETIPTGPLQEQVRKSSAGVTRWLQNAYRLAHHTDQLQWQAMQWQRSGTERVSAEIREQISEAYQQLEETAAGFHSILAEILLLANGRQRAKTIAQLTDDISSENKRLQDLTAALREVYYSETNR
jgi:hypothetical protein